MTGSLDLGCGMSSVTRPGQDDVVTALDREAASIFALEESRDMARRGRSMGGGASDTRLMDVTCIRIARDLVRSLSAEEYERLVTRMQKRREAA